MHVPGLAPRRRRGLLPLLLLQALAAGAADRDHTCVRQASGMEAVFECGGRLISGVEFASFGTPRGSCNIDSGIIADASEVGDCHAANSVAIVEDRCLGQSTCMFTITPDIFGGMPRCAHASSPQRYMIAQLKCGGDDQQVTVIQARGSRWGWQFILIVFACFALYFGFGIAYKVKREGAKLNSMEAIPHVEMWKELPYLVRDGVIFSVDTIKSKGRPSCNHAGARTAAPARSSSLLSSPQPLTSH